MPLQVFTEGNDFHLVSGGTIHELAFLGGNDRLDVNGGFQTTALMGEGNDLVRLLAGAADVYGESGNDRFDSWADVVVGYGGGGDDLFNIRGGVNAAFSGGDGADRFNFTTAVTGIGLSGDAGNDDFYGYNHAISGNIFGNAGNDSFIYFRGAAVTLNGGSGNDTYMLHAVEPATFVEYIGDGTDLIYAPRGLNVTLADNFENLTVRGYSGSTVGPATLAGNALNNVIRGHNNQETVFGEAGNDAILAYGGNDYLDGGSGNDRIYGGDGDDTLVGQTGGDVLNGGAGEDLIVGGAARDRLTGGSGFDTFAFSIGDSVAGAPDLITDFVGGSGASDVVHLGNIDADTTAAGDQAFLALVHTTPTANSIWYTYTVNGDGTVDWLFYGDVNGDTTAELEFHMHSTGFVQPDDFVL